MFSLISDIAAAVAKPQLRMSMLLAFGLACVLMTFVCATPCLAAQQMGVMDLDEAVNLALEQNGEPSDGRLTGESTNMAALFVAGFLTKYAAKALTSGKSLWAVAV
mmetsp:Transcript_98413/g.275608  ORF Transcript_98413/g.275608 Transcript_98413/m.275608 type:complete len:106 (-) Transcript_98413:22-339(-)